MALPFASAALPGCHGRPGERACEEVLLRQPIGDGPHWWVQVHRTDLSTGQARAAVARAAAVPEDLVSCAGSRDRRGRCQQWFSVPVEPVDNPGGLRNAGAQGRLKVLQVQRHHRAVDASSVVRLRWSLRLEGANRDGGYGRARAILDLLRRCGVPNWCLTRRGDGDMAKWGRMLAEGRRLPAGVAHAVERGRALRTWQEELFNRWLAARVEDGLLATCLAGEVLRGADGAAAVCADAAHGQRRLDSWEALPLGPLYGEGMPPAAGDAAVREAAVVDGLDPAALARLRGGRRAARAQPVSLRVDPAGDDLTLRLELPPDTALDSLLREILRDAPATGDDAE